MNNQKKAMVVNVNGVEISSKMAEVLSSWYANKDNPADTFPAYAVSFASKIQDHLTRDLIDGGEYCREELTQMIGYIMYIKENLADMIPLTKPQNDIRL